MLQDSNPHEDFTYTPIRNMQPLDGVSESPAPPTEVDMCLDEEGAEEEDATTDEEIDHTEVIKIHENVCITIDDEASSAYPDLDPFKAAQCKAPETGAGSETGDVRDQLPSTSAAVAQSSGITEVQAHEEVEELFDSEDEANEKKVQTTKGVFKESYNIVTMCSSVNYFANWWMTIYLMACNPFIQTKTFKSLLT